MAQTINIYIGESDKASTDFGVQESIAQVPSPEGIGLEDTLVFEDTSVFDDSNAPAPGMFADEGDVSLDDDVAPAPSLVDEFLSEEMGEDGTIPMPLDEPSASASLEDVPGPEDFEEGQMLKPSGKKSVARKSK